MTDLHFKLVQPAFAPNPFSYTQVGIVGVYRKIAMNERIILYGTSSRKRNTSLLKACLYQTQPRHQAPISSNFTRLHNSHGVKNIHKHEISFKLINWKKKTLLCNDNINITVAVVVHSVCPRVIVWQALGGIRNKTLIGLVFCTKNHTYCITFLTTTP